MGNASAFRKLGCKGLLAESDPEVAWAVYGGAASDDATKRVTVLQYPADAAAFKAAGSGSAEAARAASKPDAALVRLAVRAASQHRGLVHPHILKVESVIGADGGDGAGKLPVVIACEPSTPLMAYLASGRLARRLAAALGDTEMHRSASDALVDGARAWVAAGAHALGSAIAFLHERGTTHGAVGPDAVFVTDGGEWRLAGFGLACKSGERPPPGADRARSAFCDGGFADPARGGSVDAMMSDWRGFACCVVAAARAASLAARRGTDDELQAAVAPSRDGDDDGTSPEALADEAEAARAAAGCRASLLSPDVATAARAACEGGTLPRPWLRWLTPLLDDDPARRGGLRRWQGSAKPALEKEPAVTVVLFLAELPIKTSAEKQSFFGSLPSTVPRLPRCVREGMVLPRLLQALRYGHTEGGGTAVLAPVLAIGADMAPAAYQRSVVPAVVGLFSSRDRATRVQLMRHAASLLPNIDAATLQREVWPRAVEGLSDSSTPLREATLRAMPAFAAALPPEAGEALVRAVGKLIKDPVPGLRANAAVCGGMLAPHVTEDVRGRFVLPLLSAIAKDEVPGVRVAALRAAAHVVALVPTPPPADAVVARALPLAGQVCLTGTPAERREGIKLLRGCTALLERHSTAMAEDEARAAAEAEAGGAEGAAEAGGGGGGGGAGAGRTAPGTAAGTAAGASSLWSGLSSAAASAASSAMAAATGVPSRPQATVGELPGRAARQAQHQRAAPGAAGGPARTTPAAVVPPRPVAPAPAPAPAPADSGGWDADGEDLFAMPSPSPAPAVPEQDFLGITPVPAPAPAAAASPAKGAWDFDEDW